jgi:hypothetical protein
LEEDFLRPFLILGEPICWPSVCGTLAGDMDLIDGDGNFLEGEVLGNRLGDAQISALSIASIM